MIKIYVWKSEFFEDFHRGLIVVAATSLDAARAAASAEFDLARKRDTAIAEAARDHAFMFQDDIDAEPEFVGENCMFIMGEGRGDC